MSTVVRDVNSKGFFRLHVKGSPEKIFDLSLPHTVPKNFHRVLDFYAKKGYRVLAFGIRLLHMDMNQINKLEREDLEQKLTFCGLLIMENKLKPITTSIIDIL